MSIIKEVNMLDLSANDRQMALNEVKVMSVAWDLGSISPTIYAQLLSAKIPKV